MVLTKKEHTRAPAGVTRWIGTIAALVVLALASAPADPADARGHRDVRAAKWSGGQANYVGVWSGYYRCLPGYCGLYRPRR